MNDKELGATVVPHDASGAAEVGSLLACIEPVDMARWIGPLSARFAPTRKVGSGAPAHRQTVDKFCKMQPVGWCLWQVDGDNCVRGADYWLARLTGIVQALDCGCDALRCDECYTRGRPRKKCRYCGNLTGWDLEHAEELRETLALLREKMAQSGPSAQP